MKLKTPHSDSTCSSTEEDLTSSYVQTLFTTGHFSYECVNKLHSSVPEMCACYVTFVTGHVRSCDQPIVMVSCCYGILFPLCCYGLCCYGILLLWYSVAMVFCCHGILLLWLVLLWYSVAMVFCCYGILLPANNILVYTHSFHSC